MLEQAKHNQISSGSRRIKPSHEKWRHLLDKIASHSITLGGLGVIFAIVLIFFYLLYVVLPLFGSAQIWLNGNYPSPGKTNGKTLKLTMEEQNQVGARFIDNGQIVFFETASGKELLTEIVKIPQGSRITSFAQSSQPSQGIVAYGLNNGSAVIAKIKYTSTYQNNARRITPSLDYPMGEMPVAIVESGTAISQLAVHWSEKTIMLAAKAGNFTRLLTVDIEKPLFGDEVKTTKTLAEINVPSADIKSLLLDKQSWNLYVLTENGLILAYDLSDKAAPKLRLKQQVIAPDVKTTAIEFLNGDLSLLIGDSSGMVSQWLQVKDEFNHPNLKKIREFKVSDQAILAIAPEERRKGFAAMTVDGSYGIFHTTAERELITAQSGINKPTAITLSPRANRFLVESQDGTIHDWKIANEHPEVSLKSLWQKVWYESYAKPNFVWQSSSASNDFEPKYSLTPLVFGTMKAAFYAMIFALPLALLGAMYTAYFMAPELRQIIKPTIELMGALPTVIVGFLAGLWLAPFVEKHLVGLFLMLLAMPIAVLLAAYLWQYVPKKNRQQVDDGWEGLMLIPVLILVTWLSFMLIEPIETLLFGGSFRDWLNNSLGIGFDQRNALIIGIAMGFAVIPTIFSIAEDAIFSVPKHLTLGSLALGATPWQTMTRVVLLTASPGIFSAVMIGMGRAIGETMIVLMATGNTPVMDFSIFQGLRTLAANVAVEMPESEVNSTHYRVLFLAALVLFLATFLFNTLAEIIRQRLRQKYSSL